MRASTTGSLAGGLAPAVAPALAFGIAVALLLAQAGCGSLLGPVAPPPHRFSLDADPVAATGVGAAASAAPSASPRADAPVLVVTPPTAAAGFATDRMIYLRAPQQPEPYADSAWVDAPARLLAPMLVETLQRGDAWSAVIATPSSAVGQVQLDTQVVRLQHELLGGPGRVRFTLHATLVDRRGARQHVRSRDFDAIVATEKDDAAGAAKAARAAVREVLDQVAAFCAAADSPAR